MAGLDPAIQAAQANSYECVFERASRGDGLAWMAGSSPAMTTVGADQAPMPSPPTDTNPPASAAGRSGRARALTPASGRCRRRCAKRRSSTRRDRRARRASSLRRPRRRLRRSGRASGRARSGRCVDSARASLRRHGPRSRAIRDWRSCARDDRVRRRGKCSASAPQIPAASCQRCFAAQSAPRLPGRVIA